MIEKFKTVFKIPELRQRILFTLGLIAVFRLGSHVPVPGIDVDVLGAAIDNLSQGFQGFLGLFDLFAGGNFKNATIFALGIMPYISASIIIQLLGSVVPYFQRLQKEGEEGRKKITQITRYGTVLISTFQAVSIAVFLSNMEANVGGAVLPVVPQAGMAFNFMTILTLVTGTVFLMWLGEQITERGIGNGISLIIFAGIVAGIPSATGNTFRLVSTGEMGIFLVILLLVMMVVVVGAIVFVEQGQRRIPVQYAKRVVGRRMYGGQSTHLPLKINTSGVIPPIFASSIIMFPATIASFINVPWMKTVADAMHPGNLIYNLIYVGFIFFFCYFYTAVTFNPVDVADNMKKYGGYIPGIRPGKRTADYIDKVLTRITLGGAIYVSAVCVLPSFLIQKFNVPFYFGGTALLIVVGVAIDTVAQMESHMLSRHYEGFLKKGGVRGRGGR